MNEVGFVRFANCDAPFRRFRDCDKWPGRISCDTHAYTVAFPVGGQSTRNLSIIFAEDDSSDAIGQKPNDSIAIGLVLTL